MPLNLIFIQPGSYGIRDNGIPGDNISVIVDSNDVEIFTFGHPADGLGFTVSASDVHLYVDFEDSMNAANFDVGELTDLAQSPQSIAMGNIETTGTVTLVSNTVISEHEPDIDLDLRAGAMLLSAQTGIGVNSVLETRSGLLEAESDTGGIHLYNIGSVQIGGLGPDIDGLDAGTSGNIELVNVGSIFLTEGNTVTAAEVVHGGATNGNVTLTALGANADIIGNVDNGAVTVPRGKLDMSAGRDIQLGTIGSDFNNDIITNEGLTLTAGRDILIDGFADILSDNFGLDTGKDLVFTAGRNIAIRNLAGTSASVTASGSGGGDARMTTGFGGSLTVNGPGSFGLGSTSGDVIIDADRVLIDGGSGISAPSGAVVIRPRSPGRDIFLASASDAGLALELSDQELNRIFAPTVLIGGADAGRIFVLDDIAPTSPGNTQNLTLQSGSFIRIAGVVEVLENLTLRAGTDLQILDGADFSSVAPGGLIQGFVDEDGAADGGAGGRALVDSGVLASIKLTGNVDKDTLQGGAGNDTLDGGDAADTMVGRTGNDTYFYTAGDQITEGIGEGVDEVFSALNFTLGANLDNLTLTGAANRDGVGNALDNRINGNNGNNQLLGGNGKDTLNGFNGADTLTGGNQVDKINGGDGADLINGGANSDKLEGGADADTFRFDSALGPGNIDDIDKFSVADDSFELENSIFASLAVGTLPNAQFHLGTAAADGNDFIIYDSATGTIRYDPDGTGAAAAQVFAIVDSGLALTRFDFIVT